MGNCLDQYSVPNNPRNNRQRFKPYKRQHRNVHQISTHKHQGQKSPFQFSNQRNHPRQNNHIFYNNLSRSNPGLMTLQLYYQNLPPLNKANFRTKCQILFDTKTLHNSMIVPYPPIFKVENFKQDKHHVLMPFMSKPDKSGNYNWSFINHELGNELQNFKDFERAVKSYNHELQGCEFNVIKNFWQNGTKSIKLFNRIKTLALELPNYLTQPIELLERGQGAILFMSQMQIASILANAFYCTFPLRTKPSHLYSTYPNINFASLFSSNNDDDFNLKQEKLNCLFNYFDRVIKERPNGVVSFERKCLNTQSIRWHNSAKPVKNLQVHTTGTIEDGGKGLSEVDFANRYIGGGVISSGCVQEEIRFLLSPELIVSRLFTEGLEDNEALVITGIERFNSGVGYSNRFRYSGNYIDQTSKDNWGRRFTQVIAIDAIEFRANSKSAQFGQKFIDRELNKAYSGFMLSNQGVKKPAIATGKWGCGAFNGDPYLKCLIQLMAASEADRDLVIFTYNDSELTDKLKTFHQALILSNLSLGTIYKHLFNYKSGNILDFIIKSTK